MTATTELIRRQGTMIVESDIPSDMIGDSRSSRRGEPTRWEKVRLGLLGAGVVGLMAEAVVASRSKR